MFSVAVICGSPVRWRVDEEKVGRAKPGRNGLKILLGLADSGKRFVRDQNGSGLLLGLPLAIVSGLRLLAPDLELADTGFPIGSGADALRA